MSLAAPTSSKRLSQLPLATRIVLGFIVVAVIFALATWAAEWIIPQLGASINSASFSQKNFVMKSFMLLLTLAAMYGFQRKWALTYGFRNGENLNYQSFTKNAVFFGFLGLFLLIILNIVNYALTKKPPVGFPDEKLLHRILFIWIWSSVVEEILFRGLFQSLIGNLKYPVFTIRKATITLAVLLSALAFAALHLSLLFMGMSALFVLGIFLNTFLLGLLASYVREKTGSLYPAIWVHIVFNIIGSTPLLLQEFLK